MLSRKAILVTRGCANVGLALVLGGSIALEFPAQGFEAAAPVLAQKVAQQTQDRKAEADRLLRLGYQVKDRGSPAAIRY